MHTYRLSEFTPATDMFQRAMDLLSQGTRMLALESASLSRARLLAALGREIRAGKEKALTETTDLLVAVRDEVQDRPWVTATLDTMRALHRAGERVQLLQCERLPSGTRDTAVTVAMPRRTGSVRTAGEVCGGFVVRRRGDAAPEVSMRIYRQVCTNGAIGFAREQTVEHEGSIEDRILVAVDRSALAEAVAKLRQVAAIEVGDPVEVARRAELRTERGALAAEFVRAGDRSGWGLVNAATALARSAPTLQRRLELEGDAGRIVAYLAGGAPKQPRAFSACALTAV